MFSAVFFDLSTATLAVGLLVVVFGAAALGAFIGGRLRHLAGTLSGPVNVLQGALLGVVALVLAFGLSLALTRYEDRRASIVSEANAIGTTFLRAQTLKEPMRSRSLELLTAYTESAVRVADHVPGSPEEQAAIRREGAIQRQLWAQAVRALDEDPEDAAPRLFVETLNEMIDSQTVRVAGLDNQVPDSVLWLEIIGAALALGLLSTHLALAGRGVAFVLAASTLVAFLLFVTADLDRPTRGPIQVPDTVLVRQLESMRTPPAVPPN